MLFGFLPRQVLRPSRQWLKIAGGPKADTITAAFGTAPENGTLLEIGTYFGREVILARNVVLLAPDPCFRDAVLKIVVF